MIEKEEKRIILTPSEKTRSKEMKKTIMYKMLSVKTRRIEMEEVESALTEIKNDMFCTRGTKFGTIEVKFANEGVSAARYTANLKIEGWVLFLN